MSRAGIRVQGLVQLVVEGDRGRSQKHRHQNGRPNAPEQPGWGIQTKSLRPGRAHAQGTNHTPDGSASRADNLRVAMGDHMGSLNEAGQGVFAEALA
jgi:hypothetical protein